MHIMGKRKIQEVFEKEVYELVGEDYTVLGNYEKASIKLQIRHNKCNQAYLVRANSFLKGARCPNCFGTPKKNTEWFKEEVYNLVKNEYQVIGEYEGRDKKIKIFHTECGKEFMVRPSHFIKRNHRCPHCSKLKHKTQEQFEKEVADLTDSKYQVVGKYINNREKVEFYHTECNSNFNMRASAFVNDGQRCPKCIASKGENKIEEYLKNKKIEYSPQYRFRDCRNKIPLPFDFAIFNDQNNLHCLIEYDGKQHFEPINFGGCSDDNALESFGTTKINDSIKDEYCYINGIKLIRIPYWDFDRIDEILKIQLHN